jgi:hypothetical protein
VGVQIVAPLYDEEYAADHRVIDIARELETDHPARVHDDLLLHHLRPRRDDQARLARPAIPSTVDLHVILHGFATES